MSSIKLPKAENSKELLAGLVREVAATEQLVNSRSAAFDEISVMGRENAEFETMINEAKETMFMLLYERIEQAEISCVDDYAKLVESELELLKAREAKSKP